MCATKNNWDWQTIPSFETWELYIKLEEFTIYKQVYCFQHKKTYSRVGYKRPSRENMKQKYLGEIRMIYNKTNLEKQI